MDGISIEINPNSLNNISKDLRLVLESELRVSILDDNKEIGTLSESVKIRVPYKESDTKGLVVKSQDGILLGGMYDTKTFVFKTNKLGKFSIVNNSKEFIDLQSHVWAKDSIENLTAKGLINGIHINKFAPNKEITRAEFVALINRIMKFDNTINNKKWILKM